MTPWLKYGPLFLLLGMPVLTEVSTCNANIDFDGDGYASDIDCNDEDASIHPEAVEICDGLDQDCDGEIDEELAQTTYYPDADGDGYGETGGATQQGCAPGLVSNQLDCNDEDASIYPAAPDTAGDGVDQSCDGTDGLAPSVGLPSSSFTSIQAALDAASDGQTVWVGPGTYNEYGLNMQGKALRLASTAGQETTILDGMGLGTIFYFDSAETETSSLEGFTVTGGAASCNTPTGATKCSYAGGGMYLWYSSPTLKNVTFTGNEASGYDYYSSGGGMYLFSSSPTLKNVTFTGNTAEDDGGGMVLEYSSPTLSNVTFTGNTAEYGRGGGMILFSSSPTLNNVTFTGNSARGVNSSNTNGAGSGGGMYLSSSSPTLSNVTFTGNTAGGEYGYCGGGGMYVIGTPTLKNVTFTGNTGLWGGGMYVFSSSPTLKNVILAYNRASAGGNFYKYGTSSSVNATTSLFYNPSGWGKDNFTPTGTYLTVEPQFLDYADSSSGASCTPGSSTTCLPADLHPALGSPLINAGDPAMSDVDGSRADIGSYGGPLGDRWDGDADGAPDYFWPGEWDDAPSGFDPADYDCDDLDPDVQGC